MHIHRRLILLGIAALPVPGLTACDKLTSTTTVRTVEDGARNEKTWSRTWKDRAEFRCIASSSGRCDIVVFVSDCPGATCSTRVVTELALKPGESRKLDALPRGFKHCIAHDAKPVAPTCLNA